jgi:hypothetical protein
MIRTLPRLAALALIGCIVDTASAQTTQTMTVLELFTSQGCSSCPAADILFKAYVERPDVMALSFSVDYWDYLGWKDTLASPKFTNRQRVYGKSVSNGQIYTPQIVINGSRHVVGSSKSELEAAVAASRGSTEIQLVQADANVADGAIKLQLAGESGASPPAAGTVWLLTVRGQQTISVKRGENSGRTLNYYNSVRDVAQLGEWTGKSLTLRLPPGSPALGGDERYAVLIQKAGQGPLLAAGWVKQKAN